MLNMFTSYKLNAAHIYLSYIPRPVPHHCTHGDTCRWHGHRFLRCYSYHMSLNTLPRTFVYYKLDEQGEQDVRRKALYTCACTLWNLEENFLLLIFKYFTCNWLCHVTLKYKFITLLSLMTSSLLHIEGQLKRQSWYWSLTCVIYKNKLYESWRFLCVRRSKLQWFISSI